MAWQTMYAPQNNSPKTTITEAINAAATTLTVEDATVLPAAPNVLAIGGGDNTELVRCTSITGNILTIERGFNGTTAAAWDAGTYIYRAITAYDVSSLQNNANELNTGKQTTITATGLLKGTEDGVVAAEAGTDYQAPLVAGMDYQTPLVAGEDYQTPLIANTDYATPMLTATVLPTSGTALTANTEYRIAAAVGTYQFAFPASGDVWCRFTTSDTIEITFSAGTQYVDAAPTIEASKTYELSAKDNVVICKEVTSA